MIFAAVNYLQFRFRRGPYRPALVEELGGRLATIDNFPQYREWDVGYVCFIHGRDSVKSWAVMYYTSSLWSHVGTFTQSGRVAHATTAGVVEHDFEDLFDGRSYICVKRLKNSLTADQKVAMLSFFREQIGCVFNWLGVVRIWVAILIGTHTHFRPRFALDLIVVFAAIAALGVFHISIAYLALSCAIGYLIMVAINWPRREAMRASLRHALETP